MSETWRLTGRSTSHFTRVVRMLALELGVPVTLDVVYDLVAVEPDTFGGNPALKMPTLHVPQTAGETMLLFGTENICRKLAEIAGRADDPRVVLPHRVTSDLVRSAQEMVWHAMAAQVQLIIGVGFSKLPTDSLFFTKVRTGYAGALAWLEEHLDRVLAALPASRDVSLFEVTLFCLLDHVAFRPVIVLDAYPRLRAYAATYGTRVSAIQTPYVVDQRPAAGG